MSWIQRRRSETYYRRAKTEGYRSRAIYKLKQMDEKFSLIGNGMRILDLGAAPGGWSQYSSMVNEEGLNVAMDLVPMRRIENVYFVKGDIFEDNIWTKVLELSPDGFDLVLSDILMHTSGDRSRDQANSYFIAKRVLEICEHVLARNGKTLIKTLQGDLTEEMRREFKKHFRRVFLTKPSSSLPRSPELYILGEYYSGHSPSP
ncbi:MAG: RlmE family RNA methyltransferase [Candidatus Thermoplasmatota archaeon]|nr:RlmE family RNA methyltransferase [Candidatus Thermoplasmatota archaeon]MCL6002195.1 RlmE family RNA methyltransferase [Candidatus Thermoplasmatota archaeon]